MTTGAASTPTPIFEVGQGTKTMVREGFTLQTQRLVISSTFLLGKKMVS